MTQGKRVPKIQDSIELQDLIDCCEFSRELCKEITRRYNAFPKLVEALKWIQGHKDTPSSISGIATEALREAGEA